MSDRLLIKDLLITAHYRSRGNNMYPSYELVITNYYLHTVLATSAKNARSNNYSLKDISRRNNTIL